MVLRIGFNPTRSVHLTVLQTYACIQHTVMHNTKMNLSTVKWAQRDIGPRHHNQNDIIIGMGAVSTASAVGAKMARDVIMRMTSQ